jgi:hypothetical protein
MRVGELYEVEFWDHRHDICDKKDSLDLILCKARGRLYRITDSSITLQTWETDLSDIEEYENNQEIFVIARKLITRYWQFKQFVEHRFY